LHRTLALKSHHQAAYNTGERFITYTILKYFSYAVSTHIWVFVGAAIQTGDKIYEDNSVLQMLPFHIKSFALWSKDTRSTVKAELSIIIT